MLHTKVTYLNHSGFLVETPSWLLVFDYYPEGASSKGILRPEAFVPDKGLAVFISHSHHDHFSPEVLSWRRFRPDRLLFAGADLPLRPDRTSFVMRGGDQAAADGIRVTALESTDLGVAFLVKVDGLTLYHAGDLNDWYWEGEPEAENTAMSQAYADQMEKLRGERPDVAFLPMDPRQEEDYLRGILGFWRVCHARHLFPMHFWGDFSVFDKMEKDSRAKEFCGAVHRISQRGEEFLL